MRPNFTKIGVVPLVFAVSGFNAAVADETAGTGKTFARSPQEWKFVLGGGVQYAPEYEGSDKFDAVPLPFVSAKYGDRYTISPFELGVTLSEAERYSFGVTLGYGGGRKPKDIDSGYLDGFQDIKSSAVLGGQLRYMLGQFKSYAVAKHYTGGTKGTTLALGARTEMQATQRISLYADASATIADGNYMSGYFGVSASDSAASGYATHTAEAGLQRLDLKIGGLYMMSQSIFLGGEIGLGQLAGDAKDSPIVKDAFQPSVSLFVAYQF
jgi:outer membrane scaffolding protein for murein synthesis (MipA/OmpV family)